MRTLLAILAALAVASCLSDGPTEPDPDPELVALWIQVCVDSTHTVYHELGDYLSCDDPPPGIVIVVDNPTR